MFQTRLSHRLAGLCGLLLAPTLLAQTSTERLTNGGFETGTTPWVGTTGAIGAWSANGQPAFEGTRAAFLGGNGKAATETLYQTVTIPADATVANLSFYLHIDTQETEATVYDTLAVQVRNSVGTVLGTLATYSNLNKAAGYQQRSFNLLAYKGQTIRLHFQMVEDASLTTSFLVDKVSLATQSGAATIPTAPTNLAASVVSSNQINLTWTDTSSNETAFAVQRSTDGTSFTPVATLGANATSYAATGLTANTTYTFRVSASNAVGSSAYASVSAKTPQGGTDPWAGFVAPSVVFVDEAQGLNGSTILRNAVADVAKLMRDECLSICKKLYLDNADDRNNFTKLTLYLKNDPNGVAYKWGNPPEIFIGVSAQHLERIYSQSGNSSTAVAKEVQGVLSHEGTHGYQYGPKNCGGYQQGTDFFGFVEGTADYVRIASGLHPNSQAYKGGNWNDGYTTTGHFLNWIVKNKKPSFIVELNHSAGALGTWGWNTAIGQILPGNTVSGLWNQYQASFPAVAGMQATRLADAPEAALGLVEQGGERLVTWTAVSGASGYVVSLFRADRQLEDGTFLGGEQPDATIHTMAPGVKVPAEMVLSGVPYLVRVYALSGGKDGRFGSLISGGRQPMKGRLVLVQ